MDMRLRPATDADENLLECIYRSTREEELSLTPWDETQRAAFVSMQFIAQRTHYGRYFARSTQWIVEVRAAEGWQASGRLWRHDRPQAIHLLDVALLPEWRGRGLGSRLLRQLTCEAATTGRAVSIHVEQHNPARRLYERLGFVPEGEPEGLYQRMVWNEGALVLMESSYEQA